MKIAALFVETGGSYFNLPGVDAWDEDRDARLYRGPLPVVAHPPCQRWGKMYFGQPLAVSKGVEKKLLGDDGGCFAHALWCVRTFGGVIEHPWESKAWHEEQARKEAAQIERDRLLDELGREIDALIFPRRRRGLGLGERLARFLVG